MNLMTKFKKTPLAYSLRWGIRGRWHRSVTVKQMAASPVCVGLDDDRCEIHVLTCARDWLPMLWSVKSFYAASGARYGLCVHDDGTLTPGHMAAIGRIFPDARIVARREADAEMRHVLTPYPRLSAFRFSNVFGPKLTDYIHYARSDRILSMDSDVLFFARPDVLIKRAENLSYTLSAFNRDVAHHALVADTEVVERYGFTPLAGINAGLALLQTSAFRFDMLEEYLALPGILQGPAWLIEQQLVALCATRHGAELLPEEYDMFVGPTPVKHPVRHYFGGTCGGIRHLMYREGISRLMREDLPKWRMESR